MNAKALSVIRRKRRILDYASRYIMFPRLAGTLVYQEELITNGSGIMIVRVKWTKDRRKPYRSIRFIELSNINSVFNMVKKKAEGTFMSKLLDVEVQMLPKMCTAVQKQIQKINSKY